MALEERAMLVRLSISQWYNRAIDRKVAKEVATKYDVSLDNAQDIYVKTLLPKAAMKNVNRAILNLRAFHYAHTLPWQDDSVRILSSAMFFAYQQGVAARKMAIENAVHQLIANYPSWLKHAEEVKKGLFDAEQYPSADELRAAFHTRITFLPFPHVNDFRAQGLGDEVLNDIKTQAKTELDAMMASANQSLITRIFERLQLMQQALESEKTFRNTTVTSIIETVEIVEQLNISNDSRIKYVCDAVRTKLTGVLPHVLRNNAHARTNVALKIGQLIREFQQ